MSLSERLQEAAAARRGERPGADPAVPSATESQEPGLPAPCPVCDGPGFLDLIDVRHGRQHEHCVRCGVSWVRPI